jgi:hypothetical protein
VNKLVYLIIIYDEGSDILADEISKLENKLENISYLPLNLN